MPEPATLPQIKSARARIYWLCLLGHYVSVSCRSVEATWWCICGTTHGQRYGGRVVRYDHNCHKQESRGPLGRKSPQKYLKKVFPGLLAWRAKKVSKNPQGSEEHRKGVKTSVEFLLDARTADPIRSDFNSDRKAIAECQRNRLRTPPHS